jgi:hypothetical protein
MGSADSSVGIATGIAVSVPSRARHDSLIHGVQTGYEAQQASYPIFTGGCFPRGKAAET